MRASTFKCPECGTIAERKRVDQVTCSSACNYQLENRAGRRAKVLYRCLYWWRFNRKSAVDDLRFICREIRSWIDEDREAGRGPPPRHNHQGDRGEIRREQRARRVAA